MAKLRYDMEDREAARRSIDSLKAKLPVLVQEPGKISATIEGVYLYRHIEDVRIDCFNEPCIGVIVKGDKRPPEARHTKPRSCFANPSKWRRRRMCRARRRSMRN